ncbi:hypothetical protein [Rothia sp. ZJ1223]|uniref:hypothetical protein n=1 Tax=Rothia sp. ZJ1223 TaxID=2811098 RepID=UPI0019582ED0|nr:hypothetical protein [Rothia sp. ZJ1223]MBM7051630.1 hypothetical protein [Rothia sp. ZJ1223]
MMDYEKIQNDTKRYIEPKSDNYIDLPNFDESLHIVSEPSFDNLDIFEKAKVVSALVAFPRGKYLSKTNGTDHLSRTSPSGGARHPSELYLIVVESEFSGVYQVSIGTEDLRKISEAPTVEKLKKNIPGAFRLPVTPKLIFIVASDFERNMYRYREPRTFRTLFYYARHLGGLVESLMDTGNTISHGHQGFNDSYLQRIISSESLASESPIYIISAGYRIANSKELQVGKSFISK